MKYPWLFTKKQISTILDNCSQVNAVFEGIEVQIPGRLNGDVFNGSARQSF